MSAGVPTCARRPWCSRPIRLAIASASSWSCVTSTKVVPVSRCTRSSSCRVCSRSERSSAESGSSSSSSRGRGAKARASATRCRCPPDKASGLRPANSPSRTRSSSTATRAAMSARATALAAQAEADVVGDAHVREQRVGLEGGVHRPAVRRQPSDVLTGEHDPPGRRLDEAAQRPQQRRLAGPGAAEQHEHLAAIDREVEPIQRHRRAIAHGEPGNFQISQSVSVRP